MALLSFLGLGGPPPVTQTARLDPSLPTAGSPPSAYPAVDPGIERRTVEEMIAANQGFIDRIKLCYGCDRPTFERDLLIPIRNYAAFVNLLPATSDNFYCSAGGLFRLGLEVGFFALQGTDGHIVSGRATISTRRHLEPRWRQATFLAGLCSELHRTLSQVVVADEKGEVWPAFMQPLTTWLTNRRAPRFFVRWLADHQESRALGLFALPHIIPRETMQHLATDNTVAVPHLLSCLAGSPLYREQNILVDLVKRAAALVIDRDLIASANRYGRPILGAHIERYLLDAMRRLVATDQRWSPNADRSRVWLSTDGLFLVWPNAAADICKLLEQDELPGIPKAPDTMLEILRSAGVLAVKADDEPLWSISPPPGKAVMDAVKLASPDILLPPHGEATKPIPASIIARKVTDSQAAPRAPAAATVSVPSPAATKPRRDAPASEGAKEPSTPGLFEEHPCPPPPRIVTEHGELLGAESGEAPHPAIPAQPTPAVSPKSKPRPVMFTLKPSFRLLPQVRDALVIAIESLNGDAKAAVAVTVAQGVFIPLDFFKRQQLDASVVLRSLSECEMAIADGRSRVTTTQHEVGGKKEIGLVLKPEFVGGLNPADFAPSP